MKWASTPIRTLCWDIENKPGTYGPGDFTHGKITAIAGQFDGEDEQHVWILRRSNIRQMRKFGREFSALANSADAWMGHSLRRHDVKLTNGWLMTLGLPLLQPRRIIDTYADPPKVAGLSRSLENQCARWGCPVEKLHMPEHVWEQAYDGVPAAVELMRKRVTTDVTLTLWLFHELRRRGLLP